MTSSRFWASKTDAALGLLGGCLAAGSATFGVFMTLHGPVLTLGHSGDFTVFAQLAPRAKSAGADTIHAEDLDLTATSSIPRHTPRKAESESSERSAVVLQRASGGTAVVTINGETSFVHVGDKLPGLGEILAIEPGPKPILRMSAGVILSPPDR